MAYIKNGEVCFDEIFNVTKQTDAEKEKAIQENNQQQIEETARLAARQAVFDKLGLTADEAAALFG